MSANGSEKKIRAFIAATPPEPWLDQLVSIQKEFRTKVAGDIKWIQSDSIHITMRFLGYILPLEVPAIVECLEKAAGIQKPPLLIPGALGAFPTLRQPRVLWAGVLDANGELENLHKSVTQATARLGQPPEDRPFQAHLTLARVKQLDKASTRQLAELAGRVKFVAGHWELKDLHLMQSHLSSQGAVYECLRTVSIYRHQ